MQEQRTADLPELNVLRWVAETLARDDGDETRVNHYISCLLEQMPFDAGPTTQQYAVGPNVHQMFLKGSSQRGPTKRDYAVLLAVAVFTNHMRLVTKLLDEGLYNLDPLGPSSYGEPLYLAVRAHRYEFLNLLTADKYRKGIIIFHKVQMFRIALEVGDLDMVEYILRPEWTPMELYQRHTESNTMKEWSSFVELRTPSVQVFDRVSAEDWDPGALFPTFWHDALCHAASQGWTEMVGYLLSLDKCGNLKQPFLMACSRGQTGVISVLLDRGVDPPLGAVKAAAHHGHSETVKLLLARSSSTRRLGDGETLYTAARKGFFDIVCMLLDTGLNDLKPRFRRAPIIGAVESEHTGIFRLLVERGSRLDDPEIAKVAMGIAEAAGLESMFTLLKSCVPERDELAYSVGSN